MFFVFVFLLGISFPPLFIILTTLVISKWISRLVFSIPLPTKSSRAYAFCYSFVSIVVWPITIIFLMFFLLCSFLCAGDFDLSLYYESWRNGDLKTIIKSLVFNYIEFGQNIGNSIDDVTNGNIVNNRLLLMVTIAIAIILALFLYKLLWLYVLKPLFRFLAEL